MNQLTINCFKLLNIFVYTYVFVFVLCIFNRRKSRQFFTHGFSPVCLPLCLSFQGKTHTQQRCFHPGTIFDLLFLRKGVIRRLACGITQQLKATNVKPYLLSVLQLVSSPDPVWDHQKDHSSKKKASLQMPPAVFCYPDAFASFLYSMMSYLMWLKHCFLQQWNAQKPFYSIDINIYSDINKSSDWDTSKNTIWVPKNIGHL